MTFLVHIKTAAQLDAESLSKLSADERSWRGSELLKADIEVNKAAGTLTLTPGAGVTLNAPYLGTLVVPPGGAYTLKRGTADVWDVLALTVAA